MAKQIIKKILLVGIIIFVLIGGYYIYQKIEQKKALAQHIVSLPKFSFTQTDGKPFTNENITQNTSVVFLYFNTECSYCWYETQDIKEHISEFKNTQLIFVSTEESYKIRKFAQNQGLDKVSNVIFLQDSLNKFATIFGSNHIPSLFVYNSTHQLVFQHKGQTRAKTILKYL